MLKENSPHKEIKNSKTFLKNMAPCGKILTKTKRKRKDGSRAPRMNAGQHC